jgi:cytochrome c-type biogenesis protein CcmE
VDPERKRKIRLVIALGTAVVLAAALVYTSFSASTEAKQPSEVLVAGPGESYDLTGNVANGSVEREGNRHPFREGREVIVTGELREGTFVAERDSLVTKCPSKFAEEAEEDPDHVIIE